MLTIDPSFGSTVTLKNSFSRIFPDADTLFGSGGAFTHTISNFLYPIGGTFSAMNVTVDSWRSIWHGMLRPDVESMIWKSPERRLSLSLRVTMSVLIQDRGLNTTIEEPDASMPERSSLNPASKRLLILL